MNTSKEILQTEEKRNKGGMTMLQFRQITNLADTLGKFDEAIKWMKYPNISPTEKEAEDYINELCEEIDSQEEPESPENAHITHLESIFSETRETY